MDNMYGAHQGAHQDRTEPYRAGPDGQPELSATAFGPAQAGPPAGRGGSGRLARWAAGLVAAAVLVGGGVVLGAHLAGTGSTAASNPARAGTVRVSAAQSAALSDALADPASLSSTAFSAAPAAGAAGAAAAAGAAGGAVHRCAAIVRHLLASGHPRRARAALRLCGRRLLLVRLLAGALHGQITFAAKHGTKTIAFERGVVQSVSGGAVVVKASDGTTLTWELVSKTVVVKAGHRVQMSALASGQTVFAIGQVTGGADDARLIVIHR
jgi:hypothetical protein